MTILATGDLHLGAGPEYGDRPGARLADQQRVWEEICLRAVAERVDLFVFAGDAFHRRRPSPAELLAFAEGLRILRRERIPVVMVAGNHDVVAADLPSALEVFHDPPWVEVCRQPSVLPDWGVAALPWTPPARLQVEADDPEEARAEMAEVLMDAARGLYASADCEVLVAHWSVTTARTPSGELADLFREPVLPVAELGAIGFPLVVLGHIHNPVVLLDGDVGGGSTVLYTGAPTVVNFGEADAAHGYWIFTETAPDASPRWERRFVHTADRPFLTLDYDVRGADADVALFGSTLPQDVTDAVVRVRILADASQAERIDTDAVRRRIYAGGAARVWAIGVEADRQPPEPRPGGDLSEESDPVAALDSYLRWRGCDDTLRGRAVEQAAVFMREGD